MLPQRKRYVVDLDDPRAPSDAEWEALTPEERAEVVEALPSFMPLSEASPPEGDHHLEELIRSREVLKRSFGARGRSVYVGNDLVVYYPGEPRFAPDVLVVLDVDPHLRDSWVVQQEGKGLDLVMEVVWAGSRKKDLLDNLRRYAALGIPEYFIFDKKKGQILGFRLSPGASDYTRLLPRATVLSSEVLGLGIGIEDGHLRFYHPDGSIVPELKELMDRMQRASDLALANADERVREADERARSAEERADSLTQRLADLEAELERLRQEGRVPRG